MIDVGFIDRVRGGIGIHDVLKGGVIKGEGFTGFSVVEIRVCRRIWGGGLDHLWECQWVAALGSEAVTEGGGEGNEVVISLSFQDMNW